MHVNKQLKPYISNAVKLIIQKEKKVETTGLKKEVVDGSQDSKKVNCKLRPEEDNDGNYKKERCKIKVDYWSFAVRQLEYLSSELIPVNQIPYRENTSH